MTKDFVVINPCAMCQPMGAVYALLGIKGAMPVIHGSQGCSTYIRFQMCRHFREPINIASTSIHEDAAIFGGEENLTRALKNVLSHYHPELIGVTTSCLTETIGDDVNRIIGKFKEVNNNGTAIIPIKTPSFTGTHLDGYDATVTELIRHLAKKSIPVDRLNIIPGILSPADVREIKRLLSGMDCEPIMLTDVSESLDSPLTGSISFLPQEGTLIGDIADSANAIATIALSRYSSSGAVFLEQKYGVPAVIGTIPIGIQNTDAFLANVSRLTGCEISAGIQKERDRLIDAIVDAHEYNDRRKVAIYGDPDIVSAIVRFCAEAGMNPTVAMTDAKHKDFAPDIRAVNSDYKTDTQILEGTDLYEFHEAVKKFGAELILGNSKGKDIADDENVPLVRFGFPVYDRVGVYRYPIMGYNGSIYLLDQMTNAILGHKYDPNKLHQ